MQTETLFSETQRFKQIWLWLLLLGINGMFIYGFVQQIILHHNHTFGDKPMSNTGLSIATGMTILLSVLFLNMRLDTAIKGDGIYVRFFPFQIMMRHYDWTELQQCYVRIYHPLREYGGWGLRGIGSNRALNVSGNEGIQLITTRGAKLLIGTRKPEEVNAVLQKLGQWKDGRL